MNDEEKICELMDKWFSVVPSERLYLDELLQEAISWAREDFAKNLLENMNKPESQKELFEKLRPFIQRAFDDGVMQSNEKFRAECLNCDFKKQEPEKTAMTMIDMQKEIDELKKDQCKRFGCDIVNTFYTENKALKKENDELRKILETIRNDTMDEFGILHGEDARRFMEEINNPKPLTKVEKKFVDDLNELRRTHPDFKKE